ncbi:hypothetical protein BST61_g7042 [Cercospora zeina]
MTTIAEEDEGHLAPVDFRQLFSDVTFGGTSDALTATEPLDVDQCPLHPDVDECLCRGFVGNWAQAAETEEQAAPLDTVDEPDYSQFQNWIPRFVWPDKPCDYCRSKRLNCYIQRGEAHCTPCATLFRECSLSRSQTLEATNYAYKDLGNFLDTLHVVHEDNAREFGTYTGIKPLRSKVTAGANSTAPVKDDAPGSSKRNGIRFPRQAVKVLRDWLDAHADNPYPSEEEKALLERKTELKPSQIANWLANARRRRKVTEKSKPKLCMSPSLRPTSSAIPIPGAAEKPWDELNPFERWQHSPPENEPADLDDIANALAQTEPPAEDVSTSPSTLARSRQRKGSSVGSGWSKSRAPSTTSQETGQTSSLSASSARYSNGSSHSTHGSFSSFSSSLAGQKDRRRRRRPAIQASGRKAIDDKRRIFQCTFCTDTFKAKSGVGKQEMRVLRLAQSVVKSPGISQSQTVRGQRSRCSEMSPTMESWKSIAVNINSRCGFCAQRFTVWQERVDHLTAHFKAGARMSDWKGCRGLDPAVAAQVTNAMPPYLIGIESVSPNPFSASNRASWRELPGGNAEESAEHSMLGALGEDSGRHSDVTNAHCDGYGSTKATCWEILTVRLGKYAKQMADQGIQMTDEMLQRQARVVLYGSDDTWNQTAADNPEWLDLFKKAHGLNFIPSAIGEQGSQVPEDLETYGDLGLRIPFAVQLQAYNQAQTEKQVNDAATRPGPYQVALAKRKEITTEIQSLLLREGILHCGGHACDHAQCAENSIDIGHLAASDLTASSTRTWCSNDLSAGLQQRISELRKAPSDGMSIRSSHIARGLSSLFALDSRLDEQAAASARFAALEKMSSMHSYQSCEDTGSRPNALGLNAFAKNDCAKAVGLQALSRNECAAARARTHGLQVLASMEAPEKTPELPSMAKKPYLQRHRYELPKDKANMFATTTGAWEDSGMMPAVVDTSLPDINESTSTGAMMDFLGGDVGASLPFAHDALTSQIPSQNLTPEEEVDWAMLNNGVITPEEMDEILNTTAAPGMENIADVDMSWLTPDITNTTNNTTPATKDLVMDDFNFEDMIFDMPIDEGFDGVM